MNQRLEEFAKQSGWSILRNGDVLSPYMEGYDITELLEDFALQIIRECANVAFDHEGLDICEEILDHFGVE